MKVSIIIPIIRPEKARRCIQAIKINSGIPESDYEIISEVDHARIGCPKMVNKLVKRTQNDIVCFLGDDCVPQKDFLKNALDYMGRLPDRWGLVGFRHVRAKQKNYMPYHWMGHKKLLPHLDGVFFHEGYRHFFCDFELWLRSNNLGRYIYADNAHLIHDNVTSTGGIPSPEESRFYSDETLKPDKELFDKRRASGWAYVEKSKAESQVSARAPSLWFGGGLRSGIT